ncbi:MAG: sodium:solute symporter family protein [Peptostreptococcaceae bacterium]
MTLWHYIGAILILALITGVGIYSGKKVKSAGDFAVGGRQAGAGIIAGSIIGTLVGGASTIGTAQLAYSYGFSAWWFTLGGGIGCLILGVVFATPLYNSNIQTLPQVFAREYGKTASTVSTVLMSVGSFLSIVSQFLSGIALVTSISHITAMPATIVIGVLMAFYVIFGGVWGAGLVGIVKTLLLYITVIVCGFMALNLSGGIDGISATLPADQYFSLFARGTFVDLGAGISLVLGVLTTQAYIQAVISAKNLKVSKQGAVLSALLIPIIGIAGILVGMYMKMNYPDIDPGSALPTFVMNYLPPLVAGGIMATLLVALVGTGAGIALGLSSMICNDIYKVYFNKNANDKALLKASRVIIILILACAALFTTGNLGSLILGWSFMSMGLRGSVAFAPLVCALFMPGKIDKKCALAAMVAGPVFVLVGKVCLPSNIDSLFPGVAASVLMMIIGYFVQKSKIKSEANKV